MSYAVVGLWIAGASAAIAARAAYVQSSTNKKVARNNEIIANQQAEDATKRGETAAQVAVRKARAIASAQRAAFAARGVDLSGTAADIVNQTDFFGQSDAVTARDNAAREAWGFRARASGFQGQANASNPWEAAGGSLLSSAPAVASKWYQGYGGSSGPSYQNVQTREKYNYGG